MRVAPDEVARLRALRRQRVLDGLRHGIGISAGATRTRDLAEPREPRLVELPPLRRNGASELLRSRCSLLPDRGRDARRLHDGDLDPPGSQLDPQRVGDRLERVLRGRVGPEERERAAAADRAHEHDPSAPRAERGQERLRDRDLPDDVHFQLPAELLDRDELEGRSDRDPRVVHEPVQRPTDSLRGKGNLVGVGDVELQRLDAMLAKALGRPLVPHAPVDTPAAAREPERARLPDPGRGSRDHDASGHVDPGVTTVRRCRTRSRP